MPIMVVTRSWTPKNPDYATLVREAFAAEPPMVLIGATMAKIQPGFVEIHLPVRREVMTSYAQVVHGGVLAMIADATMAQAAYTLAAPDAVGVTLEYKINLLAPAVGERVIARGSVVKPGQKTTVAQAELFSVDASGKEKMVAIGLGTLMALT